MEDKKITKKLEKFFNDGIFTGKIIGENSSLNEEVESLKLRIMNMDMDIHDRFKKHSIAMRAMHQKIDAITKVLEKIDVTIKVLYKLEMQRRDKDWIRVDEECIDENREWINENKNWEKIEEMKNGKESKRK